MINVKSVLLLVGVFLLLYILITLCLYFFQQKFIFFPETLREDYVFTEFPDAEEIWLAKDKDHSVNALHFEASNSKGLVLFFHGNAGALDKWGHAAQSFLNQDMSVLLMDYRGYGKSRGEISTENFKQDALLAYNWAIEKYSVGEIYICGRSLGTGVATWLATQRMSQGLILETPYTSLHDMAARRFFWLPLKWLMRYDLNNVDLVSKSMAKAFIIHGTQDELIPLTMAKEVAKRYGHLFIIEGSGHNNLADFEQYHDALQKIFNHES